MRSRTLALVFTLTIAFGLAACDGGVSSDFQNRYGALIEKTYNDHDWQPLCVVAGPFPLETRGNKRCEHCEDLVAAGLLTKETVEKGNASLERFDLTESGSEHYKEDADPDLLASVRRRVEARGEKWRESNAAALAKPRFCFGKERFHHIAEALSPLRDGAITFVSVKLVTEVEEASPLLWDPKLSPLKLAIPPKPKAGQPVLQVPRVVTFRVMPGDKDAEIDNLRYGKWVNEK
jgi:hypothetical protein